VQHNTTHIQTTHVGSLPRSAAVVDLLLAREFDQPYDQATFARTMREQVAAVVARQAALGLDIVSDGETSKIGYATYIQGRLSGFGGDVPRQVALDLRDYPDLRAKMAAIAGTQRFKRAACIGPVAMVDRAPLLEDLLNLRAAVDAAGAQQAFMNSASPGLVTAFQTNQYYPTHEAYVRAVAEAMEEEYEAIVAAGFLLQLDCPDLAMARHTGFQDLTEAEFLRRAALHVEALNHAVRNIPADAMRMHICWGNYEGPHDHDIPADKVIGIVTGAKPAGILFEASNPRHEHEWVVWRDADVPDDKIMIPGVIDSCTNYVEHPELVAQRLERFVDVFGRDRVIGGTDCGFGTFAGTGRVDPAIAYRKLQSLVEGAKIATGRMFK
jgi:5-methyltetrahydropteroyltriglutamate--homocysteine methyltransferase